MLTAPIETYEWVLIGAATLVMMLLLLNTIGQTSIVTAWDFVDLRRKDEARRHAENAAAEAFGHAAALEPLALNTDGTTEEPILASVEAS